MPFTGRCNDATSVAYATWSRQGSVQFSFKGSEGSVGRPESSGFGSGASAVISWDGFAPKASPNAISRRSERAVSAATVISDPQLLRGAPAHQVLASFGSLFASTEGRSTDFELSHPVDSLSYFISHTWVTGRWTKFFALALSFNLIPAVAAGWAVGLAVTALTFLDVLGDHAPYVEGDCDCVSRTFNAWIAGQLAFVLVFLFWQEMKCWLERLGFLCPGCTSQVFMDKVCIHQTDRDMQSQAILQLGGFLRVSRSMIVVYSDIYLRRLWTVYELASFLTLHDTAGRNIIPCPTIWPLYFAFTTATMAVTHVVYHVGQYLVRAHGADGSVAVWGRVWSALFLVASFAFIMRSWLRHVHNITEHIENFSIRKADCTVEKDRSLIQGNICHFMRHLGLVPASAADSAALDAFDSLVTERFGKCLKAWLGRFTFPYSFIAAASMAYVLDAMDCTVSYAKAGKPGTKIAAAFLGSAFTTFAPTHLGAALSTVSLSRRMDLTGAWEIAYVLAVVFLFIAPMMVFSTPNFVLYTIIMSGPDHEESAGLLPLLALVIWDVMMVALVFRLFQRPAPPPREGPPEGAAFPAPTAPPAAGGPAASPCASPWELLSQENSGSLPVLGAGSPEGSQAASDGPALETLRAGIRWDRI